MNDNENYSYLQEQMHEKNVQLQYLLRTYNKNLVAKENINSLLIEGAPFRFKTNIKTYKDVMSDIFFKNFYRINLTNNPEIYLSYLKNYNYKDDYIFNATLHSIICNSIDCSNFLFNQIIERKIDINKKFGVLLNNAIVRHNGPTITAELCIGLTNVKNLLDIGAFTSVCTTHPILTAIKENKFEIFELLWNRQLNLSTDHNDYLSVKDLKSLCKKIFRVIGKNTEQNIINHIIKYCENYIPIMEAKYFILNEKLKNNNPNFSEEVMSLYYEDMNFFNNIDKMSKSNTTFLELLEQLKTHNILEEEVPNKSIKKPVRKI